MLVGMRRGFRKAERGDISIKKPPPLGIMGEEIYTLKAFVTPHSGGRHRVRGRQQDTF